MIGIIDVDAFEHYRDHLGISASQGAEPHPQLHESDEADVIYTVGGLGDRTHITLGYFPLDFVRCFTQEIVNLFGDATTKPNIGYRVMFDYNFDVSPRDGSFEGIDHILDAAIDFKGHHMFREDMGLVAPISKAHQLALQRWNSHTNVDRRGTDIAHRTGVDRWT